MVRLARTRPAPLAVQVPAQFPIRGNEWGAVTSPLPNATAPPLCQGDAGPDQSVSVYLIKRHGDVLVKYLPRAAAHAPESRGRRSRVGWHAPSFTLI
jgi:hypothetical protein